jgi:hypothetical protein
MSSTRLPMRAQVTPSQRSRIMALIALPRRLGLIVAREPVITPAGTRWQRFQQLPVLELSSTGFDAKASHWLMVWIVGQTCRS